jgi:hypothetical protein
MADDIPRYGQPVIESYGRVVNDARLLRQDLIPRRVRLDCRWVTVEQGDGSEETRDAGKEQGD